MKKITFSLIALWCCLFSMAAQAQQGGISINSVDVITQDCLAAGGSKTYTVILPGGGDASDYASIEWTASGGISILGDATGMSVTVASLQDGSYPNYERYAKGRLTVTCTLDTTMINNCIKPECGVVHYNPEHSFGLSIYKSFDLPDGSNTNAIIGPVCVQEGDSVTYSVAPWASGYMANVIGFDRYYWDFPAELIGGGTMYFSADSSSVAFVANSVISGQTISVRIGECNYPNQNPLTLTLQQAPRDPYVNRFADDSTYCMPFGLVRDTFIVANPQPNTTYEWNLRSWAVDYKSASGDTVIFSPLNNEQTVSLKMKGGCTEKTFIYDIFRSLTSLDTIRTNYGYCLPENSYVQFYLDNVPAGVEMQWSVEGEGWSITEQQARQAHPTIHTGTQQGTVTARAAHCGDSIEFIFDIKPNVPDSITGAVCLSQNDITEQGYFVEPVNNAESYEWSYPEGWAVKEDTDSTINAIVLIPDGRNTGEIKVRAVGCDISEWSTPLVTGLYPATPDAILVDSVCINAGLADTITLKVQDPIAGIVYNWVVPSALGTVIPTTGNTSQIRVATIGTEGSYYVEVFAENAACGASEKDSVLVNIVKESFTVSSFSIGKIAVYYIDDTDGEDEWFFSHTAEWFYNSDNVTDPEAYYTTSSLPKDLLTSGEGNLEVILTNTVTGCKTRKSNDANPFSIIKKGTDNLRGNNIEEIAAKELTISPNPTDGEITVSLPTNKLANIFLYDLNGKLLKNWKHISGSAITVNVAGVPYGNYVIVALQAGETYSSKVIIK
jgi:hypothetical protein